jgi:hypothetical protein
MMRRRPGHAGGEGVREPRDLVGLGIRAIDDGDAVAEDVVAWLREIDVPGGLRPPEIR